MRYIVSAISSPFGEPTENDKIEYDPENAIIQWCRMQEKYPTCVSLQADTEKSAMELLKWAKINFEKIEVYMSEHKVPYKASWVKEAIEGQLNRKKSSMQWEYDIVSPFSMG